MRQQHQTTNLEILEYHYSDIIEKLVIENNYPVDLDEDYDHLLRFIYRSIKKAWFKDKEPTPTEFEKKLLHIKKNHRKRLEILLSYIIARYSNIRGEEIARES